MAWHGTLQTSQSRRQRCHVRHSNSQQSPFGVRARPSRHKFSLGQPINPFNNDKYQIKAVYILVPPLTLNTLEITKPFIDLAIEKGVKRFVLLSATIIHKGGIAAGGIHEHLDSKPNIDYLVLRPTGFIGTCLLPALILTLF